jgi:acetoin utilization deacetylase AcuC-like enzyme
MTRSLRDVCAELGIPLGAVLEGGYDLGALARSVAATLEVLGGHSAGPADGDPAELPIAVDSLRALARLEELWPGISPSGPSDR